MILNLNLTFLSDLLVSFLIYSLVLMVVDCFIMIKVTKTIMFTAGVMYYFANLFRFQG